MRRAHMGASPGGGGGEELLDISSKYILPYFSSIPLNLGHGVLWFRLFP